MSKDENERDEEAEAIGDVRNGVEVRAGRRGDAVRMGNARGCRRIRAKGGMRGILPVSLVIVVSARAAGSVDLLRQLYFWRSKV